MTSFLTLEREELLAAPKNSVRERLDKAMGGFVFRTICPVVINLPSGNLTVFY